jgi:calcium-dependent protein kinase
MMGDVTRPMAKSMAPGKGAPRLSRMPSSPLFQWWKIRDLSEGGTCKVVKAQRDGAKQFHAAKLIAKSNPHQDSRKLWENEVRMLSRASHPNILELVEAKEDDIHFLIVTPFYDGGELFDKLYDSAHTEKTAVTWMKQILNAIRALHSKNIVHRDIKPVSEQMINRSRCCSRLHDSLR